MKIFPLIALAFIIAYALLTAAGFAGTVELAWKDQPGCSFKVWHGTALVKTVKGNAATLTLPDNGISLVRVTAFVPGGFGESAPAEISLVPVVLQTSTDLKQWKAWTTRYIERAPKMFFRITPPVLTAP